MSRRARARILLALALLGAGSVRASRLEMASLGDLVAESEFVVVARAVEMQCRWTSDGTMIVTDVELAVEDALGVDREPSVTEGGRLTVTVLGGTVGRTSVVFPGGAALDPGKTYVLLLGHADLPGMPGALVVQGLCQGAFDVVDEGDGLRAVSQCEAEALGDADSVRAAVEDGREAPRLDKLMKKVRRLAAGDARRIFR